MDNPFVKTVHECVMLGFKKDSENRTESHQSNLIGLDPEFSQNELKLTHEHP